MYFFGKGKSSDTFKGVLKWKTRPRNAQFHLFVDSGTFIVDIPVLSFDFLCGNLNVLSPFQENNLIKIIPKKIQNQNYH